MAEDQKSKLTPNQAIYLEAQLARKASQKLEPLLQLLEVPEGEVSPIEQLQDILEALLHGQRLQAGRMDDLHEKIDVLLQMRR